MDERRQHPRASVSRISLRAGGDGQRRRRYLRNLSQGGVFIRTGAVLPANSEVSVELHPPWWDAPLVLEGRVVRVEEDGSSGEAKAIGMAIQFTSLSDDDRQAIDRMIKEYEVELRANGDEPSRGGDGDRLGQELKALRGNLADADGQITDLHIEIERLEEAIERERRQVSRLQFKTAKAATTDEAAASVPAAEISTLSDEEQKLKRQLQDAETAADKAQKDLWELNADVAHVIGVEQDKAEEASRQTEKIQEKLEETWERERLRASTWKKQTDGIAARHAEQTDAQRLRADRAEQQLAEQRAAIGTINKALSAARVRYTELAAALSAEKQRRQQLDANIEEQETKNADLAAQLDAASMAAASAEAEVLASRQREAAIDTGTKAGTGTGTGTGKGEGAAHAGGSSSLASAPDGLVSEQGFQDYLSGGGRLECTEKFHTCTLVEKSEAQVSALLERADTLDELMELAPPRLQPNLVAHIYSFYARGLVRQMQHEPATSDE